MELFADWPFPAAVATLFVIVMARANATYWAGRAVRAGSERAGARGDGAGRRADHEAGPRRGRRMMALAAGPMRQAETWINRWGPIAVTLSFLTVGVQTAVNLTAGATRMPLRRYLPAVFVGCVVWALIYATVGVITLEALIRLYEVSPPVFAVVTVVGVAAVATWIVRAVRERRSAAGPRRATDTAGASRSDQRADQRPG